MLLGIMTQMASHPSILIFGFSHAGMYLRSERSKDVQAIISIHGRNEYGVDYPVRHRLDLIFDDVECPDPGDPLGEARASARRRAEREIGLVREPPSIQDAAAIIQFAQTISDL